MANTNELAELDGGPLYTNPSLFSYLENGLKTSPNEPVAIALHQPPGHLSELVKDYAPPRLDGRPDRHLTWTYAQLHEAALKLAAGLLNKGIKSGKTVASFIPNGIEWLLLLWTATLIKVPLASLDYSALQSARSAELKTLLTTCKPDLVVVPNAEGARKIEDAISATGGSQPDIIILESDDANDSRTLLRTATDSKFDSAFRASILKEALEDDPKRICLVFFTSGTSSGKPKGCPRDVASMTHYINTAKWGPHTHKSRFLLQSMNFRIILATITLAAWKVGATLVIPGPLFNPTTSLDAMEQYSVTHAQFVPATMRAITQDPSFASRDLKSVKVFLVCGDIVTRNNLIHAQGAFPTASVMTLYGMTEGGGWLIWPFADTPIDQINYIGDVSPVGKIAPGARVRIWDDTVGCVARRGQPGEIHACGNVAIKHYLDGVGESCFYDDEHGHWFRSGDIGILDEHDVFYIVSRLKDIIKRAGVSVVPAALENCIDEFTGSQSSVVPIPSAAYGQEPFAVLNSLNGKSKNEIMSHIINSFGKDYGLAGVASTDELGLTGFPLNATGKILKRELEEKLKSFPTSLFK